MAQVPIALQSYRSGSPPVSNERIINAYAESQPITASSQVIIVGSPGNTVLATAGSGPIRGGITMAGLLYVVSGSVLYSVSEGGTATQVGAGITGSAPVRMSQNGTEIAIVNGSFGWTYDTTNGLVQITSPFFYAANTVTFIDSYFLFDRLGTNQLFHSDLLDGQSYTATNFASAESHPDYVIGVLNHGERIYIFGEETIEPWFNAGASDFPFRPVDGAVIPFGCIAPLSIVTADNSPFFLGSDKVFYRLDGLQPRRLSTHGIEAIWESYSTCSDASAFSYSFNGHKFIAVKFPTAEACWEYDVATSLWHERESLNDDGTRRNWRGNCAFSAYGKTFIGDELSGKIAYCTDSVFTEFGDGFNMELVNPPIHDPDGRRLFMPSFEIEVEQGVGLTTGQGSDPQIMMTYSDNGGHTYKPLEQWKGLGGIGEYGGRSLTWRRLGSFHRRDIKLRVSDPVKRRILACRAPGMYAGL